MTDTPASLPLVILGDPDAAACEGDFCPVPSRPTPAASLRR